MDSFLVQFHVTMCTKFLIAHAALNILVAIFIVCFQVQFHLVLVFEFCSTFFTFMSKVFMLGFLVYFYILFCRKLVPTYTTSIHLSLDIGVNKHVCFQRAFEFKLFVTLLAIMLYSFMGRSFVII